MNVLRQRERACKMFFIKGIFVCVYIVVSLVVTLPIWICCLIADIGNGFSTGYFMRFLDYIWEWTGIFN